jgi:hypothetical protein
MIPKNPRLEKPHLLLMARAVPRPCLLRVPGVCASGLHDTSCCACHGNGHEWNKGARIKAHDFFSVWGCARCHNWLDSSHVADYCQRDDAFRVALSRQIVEWAKIAASSTAKPADRNAATWAIEHLITRGYAQTAPNIYATPTF